MVRITKIEIKNFRAFPRTYQINLTKAGKNLLVYGENGSGKTSLYLALKFFLESSVNDSIDFERYQNIFISEEGYIKLHLRADKDIKEDTYEWSQAVTRETKDQLILDASKAGGFLDYKELLKTNYLHHGRDSVNLFDLLINALLANATNDLTDPRRSLAENWRDSLDVLDAVQTQETAVWESILENQLEVFNRDLSVKLAELRPKVSEILSKFGYRVALGLDFQGVTYNPDKKTLDNQEILLKIEFFDTDIPSHHRFLNEAKLSAIALSIFFAGFQLQPESDLKILALDDVLIGLDMSNRLPVLDILEEYFSDYQIFLTTYDKAWYEMVKQRTSHSGQWKAVEFYFSQTDEYEIPVCIEDKPYLKKAKACLKENDYKACAIYVRTAFEALIEGFCESKHLLVKYYRNPNKRDSKHFWNAIKIENQKRIEKQNPALLDQGLIKEIELYRTRILNPLSHANITNIYRTELEDTIDAVEQLENALV